MARVAEVGTAACGGVVAVAEEWVERVAERDGFVRRVVAALGGAVGDGWVGEVGEGVAEAMEIEELRCRPVEEGAGGQVEGGEGDVGEGGGCGSEAS